MRPVADQVGVGRRLSTAADAGLAHGQPDLADGIRQLAGEVTDVLDLDDLACPHIGPGLAARGSGHAAQQRGVTMAGHGQDHLLGGSGQEVEVRAARPQGKCRSPNHSDIGGDPKVGHLLPVATQTRIVAAQIVQQVRDVRRRPIFESGAAPRCRVVWIQDPVGEQNKDAARGRGACCRGILELLQSLFDGRAVVSVAPGDERRLDSRVRRMVRADRSEAGERPALGVEGHQSHVDAESGPAEQLRDRFLQQHEPLPGEVHGAAALRSIGVHALERAGAVEGEQDLNPLDAAVGSSRTARLPDVSPRLGTNRPDGDESQPRRRHHHRGDDGNGAAETPAQPASHRVISLARNHACAAPAAHPASARAEVVGRLGSHRHSPNVAPERRPASITRNPTSRRGPTSAPTRNPAPLALELTKPRRTRVQTVDARTATAGTTGGRGADLSGTCRRIAPRGGGGAADERDRRWGGGERCAGGLPDRRGGGLRRGGGSSRTRTAARKFAPWSLPDVASRPETAASARARTATSGLVAGVHVNPNLQSATALSNSAWQAPNRRRRRRLSISGHTSTGPCGGTLCGAVRCADQMTSNTPRRIAKSNSMR